MGKTSELLLAQGYQARSEHRLEDAKRCFLEVVQASQKLEDRRILAEGLQGLGQIERDLGHGEVALQCYESAVLIIRSLDRPLKLAHAIRHIGDILRSQGQLALAEPHYEEALQIYRADEGVTALDLANAVAGYGRLKVATRHTEEARLLWREAKDLYELVGVQAGVAESLDQLERLPASA